MKLRIVSEELVKARGVFTTISPGVPEIFVGKPSKMIKRALKVHGLLSSIRRGQPMPEIIGEHIGGKIINKSVKPIRKIVLKTHKDVSVRMKHTIKESIEIEPTKANQSDRTWIDEPGKQIMVIVYHDASRAGPHIDIHIGSLSVIYKVKPELQEQLKFNNKGMLTEDSQKVLITHVKGRIAEKSKVPQNMDHAPADAREAWVNGDPTDKTYGAGKTRQIVSESIVDVYKTNVKDGVIELYAPILNPHKAMYIYKVYPGNEKSAPILIWGNKSHHPPEFEDRLHLRLIHPEDKEKLIAKSDMRTSTAKYDGASGYIVIGPKGTTVWSPRISKRTGEQIEYTMKIGGISDVKSSDIIIAMGEILCTQEGKEGYLSSATIGGLLNSQLVMPDDIHTEIRLYRVDSVNRQSTKDLPFWENRLLQEQVAKLDPNILKVVELMDPETAEDQGFEGVITVPENGTVNEGFKMKWWSDPHDWRIDRVAFQPGDKGGLAGVIHFTSLDSGKKFKLGPGQIGTREFCEAIMADPESFIGNVVKVRSRLGHEGRASKVISIHYDKGTALL